MTTSITGKIVEVMPPRTGIGKTGNEWMSQDFVIEEENGEKLIFNVFGKSKIEEYNLKVGTIAAVTVKIESTKWSDKWFTKANCSSCVSNTATTNQPQQTAAPQTRPVQTPSIDAARQVVDSAPVKADDLPF